MAMTLWPRRSGTLSETCGLGTSDAYIDAGYVFMRAHWEYPLSLEISRFCMALVGHSSRKLAAAILQVIFE